MKAICKFCIEFLYGVENDADYDGIVELVCKDCYERVSNEETKEDKNRA